MANRYAGEVFGLEQKAKWHEQRAGSRLSASLERASQMRYRAELIKRGQEPPDSDPVKTPRVRSMGGRSVEPESKPKSGRPTPGEFAWR